MKIDKEKLSKYYLMSIVIFIVVAFLYGNFVTEPKFRKNSRYTIGVFDKYRATKGGGRKVFFTYIVNGKKIKERNSVSSIDFNDGDINKKFLVQYVYGEENLSRILLEYPVPDSIKSAPANGWKELPEWAKK